MKAVKNGKLYDTETATFIAEWDNGRYGGGFLRESEVLYKSKNGRYFLVGEGGAKSKYGYQSGQNSWSGDSDVVTPLSEDEAREWCETHDVKTEIILEHFGDQIDEA